jgi:hypothetical protein
LNDETGAIEIQGSLSVRQAAGNNTVGQNARFFGLQKIA